MSEWPLNDGSDPGDAYIPFPQLPAQFQHPPAQAQPFQPPTMDTSLPGPSQPKPTPKGESSRELRKRAEKQRRDIMHQSVMRLASIVPPVATSSKKVDKTSVLRLTAHYLRAHKHVFGKSIQRGSEKFSKQFTSSFLKTMKGFMLTSTYKGLVVVVSPNIQEYLGYTELELLGRSLYKIVHPDDHQLLKEQLFPRCCKFTSNGELLLPQEPNAAENVAEALKHEKRTFMIRFKKLTHQRSQEVKYLTCHVEGSFRKSDDAGVYVDNQVQTGRRIRSRGNNPYASGNDIVFIGMIRPITETFTTERRLESLRMEYRTRHSIDGSIIQSEHRICLVTGYMIHEVHGVNAMNFMHRDDVRWVVVALREMYVNQRLMGESCYRLMTKNGKFIHMRTRGALEVDSVSNEATSFVCTNTVVPEDEGLKLIQQMKNNFSLKIDNEDPMNDLTENPQGNENQSILVEDPRQLEQVIYHLVTDLPSPRPEENTPKSKDFRPDLSIIPPEREQIKRAIEKSYSVFQNIRHSDQKTEKMSQEQSSGDDSAGSVQDSSNANSPTAPNTETAPGQIDQQDETAVNGETQACEPPWTYYVDDTGVHAPSTSSYNPEVDPSVHHFGQASREFEQMRDNAVAQWSQDPDLGYDEYGIFLQQQAIFNSLSYQINSTEVGNENLAISHDYSVEMNQFSQCCSSTATMQPDDAMDVLKKMESDDDSATNNCWSSPASFNGNFGTSQANHDEDGRDAWPNAEPFFTQIPEASTFSATTSSTFSYSHTSSQITVTSNTPDPEVSSSMDTVILQPIQQDDSSSNIDKIESLMSWVDEVSQLLYGAPVATAGLMETEHFSENFMSEYYEENFAHALEVIQEQNEAVQPVAAIAANNQYDPYEFVEDYEPI